MKSTALIPSLLVGSGALATSIVVSQTSSYDPMSSFIEYKGDEQTIEVSIKKISELIKEVKSSFETLKKKIEDDEKLFEDYKKMLKDDIEEKEKMKFPRAKELARTNFLKKILNL